MLIFSRVALPRSSLFSPSFLRATRPPISNSFCYPRRWSGVSLLALNPCSPNLKVSINWIKNQNHEPRSWFFLVCGLMPRCLGYDMIPNQKLQGGSFVQSQPQLQKSPLSASKPFMSTFQLSLAIILFIFFRPPYLHKISVQSFNTSFLPCGGFLYKN